MAALIVLLSFLLARVDAAGERFNHAGRILPPTPAVTQPILFNTPESDAVVSSLQIFPIDSAWNEDISRRPTLSNSNAIISQISTDLASKGQNRQNLRLFYEMNWAIVPNNYQRTTIDWFEYADESDDASTWPIPSPWPLEQFPQGLIANGETYTISEWEAEPDGGDKHGILVTPNGGLWETWITYKDPTNGWMAANGAFFNFSTNYFRPGGISYSAALAERWTSADAAGLPMFPAVIRYDEVQRGEIEHAMRCIVAKSANQATGGGPIYPATHLAGTNIPYPSMGHRIRLKANKTIPSTWSRESKIVAAALKKYGCIVADNGGFFSLSVSPDNRWEANGNFPFSDVQTLNVGTDFEVIESTTDSTGPRSPGAPSIAVIPDKNTGLSTTLTASVTVSMSATVTWYQYADPHPNPTYLSAGNATINTPMTTITSSQQVSTDVTFPVPGKYYIVCAVNDGVHTTMYQLATVTASNASPGSSSSDSSSSSSDSSSSDSSPSSSPTNSTGSNDNNEGSFVGSNFLLLLSLFVLSIFVVV